MWTYEKTNQRYQAVYIALNGEYKYSKIFRKTPEEIGKVVSWLNGGEHPYIQDARIREGWDAINDL